MTRAARAIVLVLTLVLASTAALAGAPGPAGPPAVVDPALAARLLALAPGEALPVIVTVKDGVDPLAVVAPLAPDARAVPSLPIAGALLARDDLAALARDPRVRSLWLDRQLAWDLAETAPLVGAPDVWETFGATGRGVTVAVFDTGIDTQHPDLTSRVVAAVRPYGVTHDEPAFVSAPRMADTGAHGTHVAGIIAGTGASSDRTYRGIAPGASLVALGWGPSPTVFHVLTSYGWILQNREAHGIRVVANSWGIDQGGYPMPGNPINVATLALYDAGLVVVFSAGNDGPDPNTLGTIKAVPWVVATAAGTKDRGLIYFSSRGVPEDALLRPDLTAPGYLVYSARAVGAPSASPAGILGATVTNPKSPAYTPFYRSMSGTSMASPHVSGTVALMLEGNAALSPDQVIEILRASADPMVNATTGEPMPEWEVGAGFLNATRAYLMARETEGELERFLEDDSFRRRGLPALVAALPALDDATPVASETFEGAGRGEHEFVVPDGARLLRLTLERTNDEDSYQVVVTGPDGERAFDFGAFVPGTATHVSPVTLAGTYVIRVTSVGVAVAGTSLVSTGAGYALAVDAFDAAAAPLASLGDDAAPAPLLDVPSPAALVAVGLAVVVSVLWDARRRA